MVSTAVSQTTREIRTGMGQLSMEPVYVFTWDNISVNAYSFGSQIAYPKPMTVQYQNSLQPSGRPLYTWASTDVQLATDTGTRPNSVLPILKPGVRYHLILDMDVTPVKSVGISIEFFNYDGQLLNHSFGAEQVLDFVFPEAAADYKISLVKFNNEQVEFRTLMLFETDLYAAYEFDWTHAGRMIRFNRKQSHKPYNQVSVVFKHQYQPINTVYVNPATPVTYTIEMDRMDADEIGPFVQTLLDELKVDWDHTTQLEVTGIGLGTAEVVQQFKQAWHTTIR